MTTIFFFGENVTGISSVPTISLYSLEMPALMFIELMKLLEKG